MSQVKSVLKKLINNTLGALTDLRVCSTQPRGRFFFDDIKPFIPAGAFVLDVGANRGQWCLEALQHLPSVATIICFEPMPTEFQELTNNTCGDQRIRCLSCALSSTRGKAIFYQGSHHTTNSLTPEWDSQPSLEVELETLDSLSYSLGLEAVSLLKIDTEGHDLHVLQGAHQLLSRHCFKFILTEVCFDSSSRLGLFDHIRSYLESFDYRLFGLYDQQPAWDGKPALIYANACFISPKVARLCN